MSFEFESFEFESCVLILKDLRAVRSFVVNLKYSKLLTTKILNQLLLLVFQSFLFSRNVLLFLLLPG